MEITVSQAQGRVPVTVLSVNGPITSNQALEQAAQQAFDAGASKIVLDLSEVAYISTSGLRALHFIYTLLRTSAPEESDAAVRSGIAAGTFSSPHLKLVKPSAKVSEALKVSGYDMFLEIHNDLQRAIASF